MSTKERKSIETAGDIARRYGLADLTRARTMARRLYFDALVRRASHFHQDMLAHHDSLDDVLDHSRLGLYSSLYGLPPVRARELPPPSSSYFLGLGFGNELVTARESVPVVSTRLLYDRRLAEATAARMKAVARADRLLSRYVSTLKNSTFAPLPLANGGNEVEEEDDVLQQIEEEEIALREAEAAMEASESADSPDSGLVSDAAKDEDDHPSRQEIHRARRVNFQSLSPSGLQGRLVASRLIRPRPRKL